MDKIYIPPKADYEKLRIESTDQLTAELSISDYPAFDEGTLPVTPP